MTRQDVKRQGSYAATGTLLASIFFVLTLAVKPWFDDWRFSDAPYQWSHVEATRVDGRIVATLMITKTAQCDPSGAPLPFARWSWAGGHIQTTPIMIGDRQMIPRNVIGEGESVMIGPVWTPVPPDLPPGSAATIKVVTICDRGDGKWRSYAISPSMRVPGHDGPVAVE